ncbi:MAG: hypothetical protein N5P05_000069 [Chroococcopsis gigantea SAG 12.99]|nr:hypothetical protein [Chroococcopsis gigantea SAG 12.99]
MPDAKSALEKTSSALTRFRTDHNLDNPDNNVSLAYTSKQELQKQLETAQIELGQLNKREQEIKSQMLRMGQNPATAVPDAALSQEPGRQALLQQLNNLEIQYSLEQSRYTDRNPILQDIKERRDRLRGLLRGKNAGSSTEQKYLTPSKGGATGTIQQDLASQLLQTQINIATQQKLLSDLREQGNRNNLELEKMLRLQQKYKELDRQYQFQAKMVDEFLSKLQELRIKESQNTFTWKLIEPPNLPIEPIGNSRIRGLVLGAIAGILSGVGIAFFLEKSDSRVRDVGDIQGFTQLPLLAVIPQFHFPLSLESVSDAFTESIRSLSLTLSFQNIQTSGQIIAITSATPGEGKTTITHHLGLALAELGKKVLIVDGNFANPKLHEIFSLPNHQGLTTLIATDRPWSEIIQSFPRKNAREEGANMGITNSLLIASNSKEGLNYLPNISGDGANNGKVHNNRMGNNSNSVCTEVSTRPVSEAQVPSSSSPVRKYPDILTSGPVGTNSFTWLIAPQIVKLLNSWIQAYDYVLFDTSSLTESADAQSISAQVDAVILVIGEKKVEKSMVMESLKILERNNSQGIGIVFNTLGTGKGRKPNKIYNSFSGND